MAARAAADRIFNTRRSRRHCALLRRREASASRGKVDRVFRCRGAPGRAERCASQEKEHRSDPKSGDHFGVRCSRAWTRFGTVSNDSPSVSRPRQSSGLPKAGEDAGEAFSRFDLAHGHLGRPVGESTGEARSGHLARLAALRMRQRNGSRASLRERRLYRPSREAMSTR
jgi:hypothetical protein